MRGHRLLVDGSWPVSLGIYTEIDVVSLEGIPL